MKLVELILNGGRIKNPTMSIYDLIFMTTTNQNVRRAPYLSQAKSVIPLNTTEAGSSLKTNTEPKRTSVTCQNYAKTKFFNHRAEKLSGNQTTGIQKTVGRRKSSII